MQFSFIQYLVMDYCFDLLSCGPSYTLSQIWRQISHVGLLPVAFGRSVLVFRAKCPLLSSGHDSSLLPSVAFLPNLDNYVCFRVTEMSAAL